MTTRKTAARATKVGDDAAEVVEARVIEKPETELRVTSAKAGSPIVSNFEAVRRWVEDQTALYATPNIRSEEDYRQAKRDRTAVRAIVASVEGERKRVKQLYMAPVSVFEDQVRTITDPVKALDVSMKGAIDEWDARAKEARRARLREHYEELAPDIALPLEGASWALVPFERILDPSWTNRSVQEGTAAKALEDKVSELAHDEETLDSLGLPHASEAKAAFWSTLSIKDAIARNRQIEEGEARQRALEAERQAREETQAAERQARMEERTAREAPAPVPTAPVAPGPAPTSAPVPAPAPAPMPAPVAQGPAMPCVMVIERATVGQMREIGSFAGSIGVTGRFLSGTLEQACKRAGTEAAHA